MHDLEKKLSALAEDGRAAKQRDLQAQSRYESANERRLAAEKLQRLRHSSSAWAVLLQEQNVFLLFVFWIFVGAGSFLVYGLSKFTHFDYTFEVLLLVLIPIASYAIAWSRSRSQLIKRKQFIQRLPYSVHNFWEYICEGDARCIAMTVYFQEPPPPLLIDAAYGLKRPHLHAEMKDPCTMWIAENPLAEAHASYSAVKWFFLLEASLLRVINARYPIKQVQISKF